MSQQRALPTPVEQHYLDVVRNLSWTDIQRVEAGEVSANECVQSDKMAAAVAAWGALLKERGIDSGIMPVQV